MNNKKKNVFVFFFAKSNYKYFRDCISQCCSVENREHTFRHTVEVFPLAPLNFQPCNIGP